MSLDPDTFRSVLGRFATGVTVLTTTYGEGKDHGMTVSSFCSLSLSPPLVALCVDSQAEMHGLLAPGVRVIVNVLSAHQEMLSRRFAEFEGSQRFDGIGFTRSSSGIPILDDVLAWLECDIVTRHDGGDHGLYIASVERATAREGLRPLLHYRGGYAQLER